MVVVDSNGRGATAETINSHIPREERDNYEIEVKIAYTLEEVSQKINNVEDPWDVRGAIVILDTLTNNVRGTKTRKADSPRELVNRVARVRGLLYSAGAVKVVTCQVKPMTLVDVRPYNGLLHEFLCGQPDGGPGCETQIRMSDLKPSVDGNGFHILPECETILDRTYACAIRNVPVPCPTLYM